MNRETFLKVFGMGLISPALFKLDPPTQKKPELIKLSEFFIAGFKFYEGNKILSNLNPGDTLNVIPETENKYDNRAIRLETQSGKKLGYIPRDSNEIPSNILKENQKLTAKIKEIYPTEPDWYKVFIELFLIQPTL